MISSDISGIRNGLFETNTFGRIEFLFLDFGIILIEAKQLFNLLVRNLVSGGRRLILYLRFVTRLILSLIHI